MTNDTDIRPALTPDEWAMVRGLRDEIDTLAFQMACLEPDNFGAMALANASIPDNDPRKITRADADFLLGLALEATQGYRDRLEQISNRLAALLPPE